MIMKTLTCQWIAALMVGVACAQTSTQPAPEWKATVRVVDEIGQPVAGANVTIGYYVKANEPEAIATDARRGVTDTNGMFWASARSSSVDLTFAAAKEGYYKTRQSYELGAPYEYDRVKWSPSVTLVLKRIINPVAMYAKWVNTGVPVTGKPAGFDLMAGDWVAPHGKGTHMDIFFTAEDNRRAANNFDYRLIVSFPNAGDGIQAFETNAFRPNEGSALRSPHEAPESGYEPQRVKTQSQRPGEPSQYGLDDNLNFFFRVRTVLDAQGNIQSALYGKIYGDFMHFRYYLNPTPNDRNVEFDPKRNLLPGLRGSQIVDAP